MTVLEADCAVVGAGPAGLAAARAAVAAGARSVLVFDRDDAPGGLPRFCRHPGFGWEYSRRLETGPSFARRLLGDLDPARVALHCGATVMSLQPGPCLEVLSPALGLATVRCRGVVLATGIRERPRAARLVPGRRPERGILTTGQLQQMVARGVTVPGSRLAVVGSEHVAFSVLLTARHSGHRVVAMIEAEERPMSYAAVAALARALAGVPTHLAARVVDIAGGGCVEAVEIEQAGRRRTIACDAVVFAGDFVPDVPLARAASLAIGRATQGPEVDQLGRTSLAGVFAAGNVLRAVESSGFAAIEGARVGAAAAAYAAGRIGWRDGATPIALAPQFAYLVPQLWAFDDGGVAALPASLRAGQDLAAARIGLRHDGSLLWQGRKRRLLRHRRLRVDLGELARRGPGAIAVEAGSWRAISEG
ncbi:MAG: NAD(P)/FAD-dependent oxidoreductase [Alphaproteobacteria bacterium]|nr:NAD(P)/FAD-dependent oxidoreductase [Alphaproteobacteria bacterium]